MLHLLCAVFYYSAIEPEGEILTGNTGFDAVPLGCFSLKCFEI